MPLRFSPKTRVMDYTSRFRVVETHGRDDHDPGHRHSVLELEPPTAMPLLAEPRWPAPAFLAREASPTGKPNGNRVSFRVALYQQPPSAQQLAQARTLAERNQRGRLAVTGFVDPYRLIGPRTPGGILSTEAKRIV